MRVKKERIPEGYSANMRNINHSRKPLLNIGVLFSSVY